MRRDVKIGCMMPMGYGISYVDYVQNVRVCYPIPLNIVVRWARNLVWWLGARGYDAIEENAWSRGYWQGREDERLNSRVCSEREWP